MTLKRFTLVLTLLALLTAGVSANDTPGPKGYTVAGYWHSGPSVLLADPIVQEATGLEGEGLARGAARRQQHQRTDCGQ